MKNTRYLQINRTLLTICAKIWMLFINQLILKMFSYIKEFMGISGLVRVDCVNIHLQTGTHHRAFQLNDGDIVGLVLNSLD